MSTPSTRPNSNRTRCRLADCTKFAQTRGLCKAHGGGSRCRDPDCHKLAQSRGRCIAHGGGRRCIVQDCHKLAQSTGHCISHGCGRRCAVFDCEKFSQVRGYCKAHAKVLIVLTPPSPPTHAALMTPAASTSNTFKATLPPVKSKLSIDFLVNPSDQPKPTSTRFHSPMFQLASLSTARVPNNVFIQQHSLLSFLKPH